MKMRLFIISLGLVAMATSASSQQTVITQPLAVTSNTASSGAIVSGGTYQSVFAADTSTRGRSSCTIQNTGSDTLYVFFGPIASASHDKSVQLTTGQATYCATPNGGVLKDQVSVDGTTAGTFYAAVQ